ncbi:MAG: hypothetical protein EOP61_14140 [Sphingomonadales bacterium]|nr:MAG: hypothetical protein EOP61_14140 [Sphingomonadales bacterium]
MRTGFIAAILLAGAALLPAAPACAQSSAMDTMQPSVDALKPGQFVWYPHYERASLGAPVKLVISIPQQLLFAYRDGQLIAVSTVSTGSEGRETPTGEFTILQKKTFHRSNLYSNAPMPYMQRLTWDGIAIHAGHLPGYPASHGCIRLPKEFARQLYEITAMGGQVSVVDDFIFDTPGKVLADPAPVLVADASRLGGDAFDMVTMEGPPPARQPASWVAGPARELVQPIPPGSR